MLLKIVVKILVRNKCILLELVRGLLYRSAILSIWVHQFTSQDHSPLSCSRRVKFNTLYQFLFNIQLNIIKPPSPCPHHLSLIRQISEQFGRIITVYHHTLHSTSTSPVKGKRKCSTVSYKHWPSVKTRDQSHFFSLCPSSVNYR